jgi:hypothetical protein
MDEWVPSTVLEEDECWRLLGSQQVGRLAVTAAGEQEIFPVNHVVQGRSLMFRTAEGTKLAAVVVSPMVAFEVDGYDPEANEAWSVVVKGQAERLERFGDIYTAEELPLFPWHTAPKPFFVRISPQSVTGRRFTAERGPRDVV